jgi:hypothetical protein
MKQILLFTVMVFLGLNIGCKKDEDKEVTPQELIIGKWKATKAVIAGSDVLIPTSTSKTELEIEFRSDKTLAFNWTNTILTNNPPTVTNSTLNGSYSWNGDILTITAVNGSDVRTVTGPVVISETEMVFTPNSGDTSTFVSLLEAEKL